VVFSVGLQVVGCCVDDTPFNVFASLISDPGEPADLKEALSGPERNKWTISIKAEIMNFIHQKAWKKIL
jgi:hypothetical protein